MKFIPENSPFPFWTGPYSPRRGKYTGFRIVNGQLITNKGKINWVAEETEGISQLIRLVTKHWGGGRILFLPSSHIIKPLQEEDKLGQRVVVGKYEGDFKITTNNQKIDFNSVSLSSGTEWTGPDTIGLECTIRGDGSLDTTWTSDNGDIDDKEKILGADKVLLTSFKKVRPNRTGGRVRITVGGIAYTKEKIQKQWKAFYIGRIDTSQFSDWDKWIERQKT